MASKIEIEGPCYVVGALIYYNIIILIVVTWKTQGTDTDFVQCGCKWELIANAMPTTYISKILLLQVNLVKLHLKHLLLLHIKLLDFTSCGQFCGIFFNFPFKILFSGTAFLKFSVTFKVGMHKRKLTL